jgi:hypothetical protein
LARFVGFGSVCAILSSKSSARRCSVVGVDTTANVGASLSLRVRQVFRTIELRSSKSVQKLWTIAPFVGRWVAAAVSAASDRRPGGCRILLRPGRLILIG